MKTTYRFQVFHTGEEGKNMHDVETVLNHPYVPRVADKIQFSDTPSIESSVCSVLYRPLEGDVLVKLYTLHLVTEKRLLLFEALRKIDPQVKIEPTKTY